MKHNPIALGILLMAVCLAGHSFAAIVPADSDCVRSLDGTWRFKLEQPGADTSGPRKLGAREPITTPAAFEPFFALDYKEDASWHDLAVPGNWEMAGFSPATYDQPDNASGFYRKWFEVPKDWKGREVRINFDGVQNGAEVWLNGKPVNVSEPSWGRANYHESGWTAWQADLTPQVKIGGKNLLAIRVTKNTQSSDLDSGDYFFLGGVYRLVTLFSVPRTHVEDLTVVTKLLDSGKAEVKVTAEVSGGPAKVSMRLGDLKPVEAKADGTAQMSISVFQPKLWTAEHPNLYPLTIELKDAQGKVLETITRKVGIREIAIRDAVFTINGAPVKLRGICRHDLYLPVGTAVGPDLWRKDLELMKAANINAVRTSHYPYGSGFYDLCDEMGFYVVDELPYCWCPTNTAELTPAYTQRARETIARDKNHPCVVIWAIGNENKPGINQKIVADLVRELDPTRPRLNSWRPAEENGVEFDDRHYTNHVQMAQQAVSDRRAKWPIIYTENPNVWDVRNGADYGCLDAWCPVIERCWEDLSWKYDGITGGFLWEWQDRAVIDKFPVKLYQYDPVTGVNYVKTKGLVDGWRNPRPDYYHVKMVYSPIKVGKDTDLASMPGYAILDITNRYDFTDLSEVKARWQLLQSGKKVKSGTTHFHLAPRTSGKVELALPDVSADTLRIDFDHPGGWNIVTCRFDLVKQQAQALPTMTAVLPQGIEFPMLNLVRNVTSGDPYKWNVAVRYRGSLINVKTDPAGADDLAKVRSMDADIVLDKDSGTVVAHVHAEYAGGRFSYRIDWLGEKSDIQELGWTFEMPHAFDHFSWKRQAYWSYYPETHIGRPSGTALPDSADVHNTDVSRPDAFDFNSTKYDCDWASLTDTSGHGLRVEFEPDQRHDCKGGFGANGAYRLIVNKQCSPPRDISSNQVPEMYLMLDAGDSVEGSFCIGSE